MGQGSEVHVRNYFRGRRGVVDGDDAPAGSASPQIGLVALIQSEVPQHNAFGPIPRCTDDQLYRFLKQLPFLPLAARTLREPNVLVGKTIVEFGLRRRAAAITMNGDAWNESRGLFVA